MCLLSHVLCTFDRFQDAASYMSAVADAMEAAREEIFITDWWYGCVYAYSNKKFAKNK